MNFISEKNATLVKQKSNCPQERERERDLKSR